MLILAFKANSIHYIPWNYIFFHILALYALDPREQLAHEIQTVTNFAQQKQSNSFEMDKLCQFRSVPKKLPEKNGQFTNHHYNYLQLYLYIS